MVIDGQAFDNDAVWDEIEPLLEDRGIPQEHYPIVREELARVPAKKRYGYFEDLVDRLDNAVRDRLGFKGPWPRRQAREQSDGRFWTFMKYLTLGLAIQNVLGRLTGAMAQPIPPRLGGQDGKSPLPASPAPTLDQALGSDATGTCPAPLSVDFGICPVSEQPAAPYSPPKDAQTFSNVGYFKDWINAPLSPYPSDPTTINGVSWLAEGTSLTDGYYAYAYRQIDNRVAVFYTGTAANTNNAVPHSYLASGKEVYAAGMLTVEGGVVTRVNSASGHYQPTPSLYMNEEDCTQQVRDGASLGYISDKLADLHLAAPTVIQTPFRHPSLDKQIMDCQADRSRQNGLTWNEPR